MEWDKSYNRIKRPESDKLNQISREKGLRIDYIRGCGFRPGLAA